MSVVKVKAADGELVARFPRQASVDDINYGEIIYGLVRWNKDSDDPWERERWFQWESLRWAKVHPERYLNSKNILIHDDVAWVAEGRYERLDIYDCSLPTGVYYGKCWKRYEELGFYAPCDPIKPGFYDTCFRPIQVMPERVFSERLCSTCHHPHLSHTVGRPNPCNVFRCTCKQFTE